MRKTHNVLAYVKVAIRVSVLTLPMFLGLTPFTLVSISVRPCVNTISVRKILLPLSRVSFTFGCGPHPIAMLETLTELPFILVAVRPLVDAMTLAFAVGILPSVCVT
jgi:hypothetical protein